LWFDPTRSQATSAEGLVRLCAFGAWHQTQPACKGLAPSQSRPADKSSLPFLTAFGFGFFPRVHCRRRNPPAQSERLTAAGNNSSTSRTPSIAPFVRLPTSPATRNHAPIAGQATPSLVVTRCASLSLTKIAGTRRIRRPGSQPPRAGETTASSMHAS